MKVEIKQDGYIYIIAETATEAYALKHLTDDCNYSGTFPIVIDCSILIAEQNVN